MKTIKQVVAALAVLAIAPSAFASKYMHDGYLGVDLTQTNQGFKSGYGKGIFKQNAQEYGAFGGFKFSHHFGVEAGWEQQVKKKRSGASSFASLDQGHIAPTGTFNFNSSVKGSHPYLGIFGEMKHHKWKFQAMLGASFSNVKIRAHSLSTTGAPVPSIFTAGNIITGKKNQVVPMVKLNVMHCLTDNFSLRVSANYRNLSGVKIKIDQDPLQKDRVKLRDTFGLGLGVIYSFH